MNKFGLTLSAEMPVLYQNLIKQNGFVPKLFTFVSSDGSQYVFFLDNIDIDRETEGDLYRYILKKHNAVAYSRGFLAALESGRQEIYIVVIGANEPFGIQIVSPIQRDSNGTITNIGEFKLDTAPTEKLAHGWWLGDKDFSIEKSMQLSDLWNSIKSNAMHREMKNFVNE